MYPNPLRFLSAFNTRSKSVIYFRVISHILEAFDGKEDERCQVKSEKNFLVLSHVHELQGIKSEKNNY